MVSKLPRFALAMSLAALAVSPLQAEPAYPNKAITVVVPVAAGGAADGLARAWGDYIGKALGQPVVVDNKPGANGSIAASYVAKQPANGYTILFGSTSNMSLNPFSYKTLTYDPVKDFDPVLMLAGTSQVLVASPASGIRTLDDLVKMARAKPDALNYGSAGKGNSTHLNVEFVAQHYGLQMTHVPYKGAAPAMVGLLGGETQITADAITSVIPQVKSGKVVPIVIFGDKRSPALPGVPTVYEAGLKEFPAGGWYGLMVPKGTPKDVIVRLNDETKKFWADPAVKVRMEALQMDPPTALGPEAVARTMREEARVWGPIITRLGIQND
ncbi:tripartite tricarboxylate transporter substrate binding protein [Variovorax robiniae]|uniref:Tripartite tricarboxylate transporter substrate binding protein n=1 Tax=Variovorax robiniae TaxID=1836199 RepID=A0ABU8XBI6_9BURK